MELELGLGRAWQYTKVQNLFLPMDRSREFKQLQKTEEFAKANEMQLYYKKTKWILFNPLSSIDFMPLLSLSGNDLEVVDEVCLLNLVRCEMVQ